MTAEIAIMNTSAIALAADSAVTIEHEGGTKTYSANKLFALSKYRPVGIMVHGNAVFMGVPWETIIKTYRKMLGTRKLRHLKQYADHFISFLQSTRSLFPRSRRDAYLKGSIRSYFSTIRADIWARIERVLDDCGKITDAEVKKVVADCIDQHLAMWKEKERLPGITRQYISASIKKYNDMIMRLKKAVFEKLPITRKAGNQLKQICGCLLARDWFGSGSSGVVIAGYGEADIFPRLESFQVEGVYHKKLKYMPRKREEIDLETAAVIISFAQIDVISTFMEGIDPACKQAIHAYLSELFSKYPAHVIEMIGQIGDNEKKAMEKKLQSTGAKLLTEFNGAVEKYLHEQNVGPVVDAVAVLPKEELAAMAEALVNLTAFKRKVSMAAETVAGPTDVAVISKGDGLIWIKRKHYFNPELNRQFFANYYSDR